MKDSAEKKDFKYEVLGTVRDRFGKGMADCTVKLYIKKLRESIDIGYTSTDRNGFYLIKYIMDKPGDIFIKVLDKSQNEILRSEIVYNANKEEQIDLMEGGETFQGEPEFDTLMQQITPIINDIDITELNYDDVEYIYKTLEIHRHEVMFVIISQHLSKMTELEPEVFYAFLKQNQPRKLSMLDTLKDDFDNMDIVLDNLLKGIVSIDDVAQESIIGKSVKNNLISLQIQDNIDIILEKLYKIKIEKALEEPNDTGTTSMGEILSISLPTEELRKTFMEIYLEYNGDMELVWEKISEQQPEFIPDMVEDLKETLAIGELTENHIPMIVHLKEQLNDPDQTVSNIADFSILTQADWNGVITGINLPDVKAYPDFIEGETEEEKINTYAFMLEENFDRVYSTTAFINKANVEHKDEVKLFISNAAFDDATEFDLKSTNIDRLRIDKGEDILFDGIEDDKKETIVQETKAIQRVLRIAPDEHTAQVIYNIGWHSAQQMCSAGKEKAINTLIENGVSKDTAAIAYSNAERICGAVISQFARFNTFTNQNVPACITPWRLPVDKMRLSQMRGSEEDENNLFPDLKTLFGSMDYCSCKHCSSLISPAAYLVDILLFLKERGVKSILVDRRPDIEKIPLNCKNNTPMPYIDLVCEVLENAIYPQDEEYETKGTEAELKAHPEYVNIDAYKELVKAKYPLSMPFDLWTEEARIYLEHMGIKRYELMELLSNSIFADSNDTIIPINSIWKYLDDGLDQGTEWREPSFDDSTWASGQAELGYGDGDETTVVSYGSDSDNKYITTYFRRTFNITDTSIYKSLTIRILKDDGAVVYLNGVEVVRTNMPSGIINYNTLASTAVAGSDETSYYEVTIDPDYLVNGNNVLSVEVHQVKSYSSDISFNLELIGDKLPTIEEAAEYLGINNNYEISLICDSKPEQFVDWEIVHYDQSEDYGDVGVSYFLHKTGVSYNELKDLLDCQFINSDEEHISEIAIKASGDDIDDEYLCNMDNYIITNMNLDKLDNIHRFLRLWKKTGWKMWELDIVILNSHVGNNNINRALLAKIKVFKQLQQKLKLNVEQLLSFYGLINIKEHMYNGEIEKSLYEQLFLNTTIIKPINPAFEIENITNNNENLLDHKDTIIAALLLSENELELLLSLITDNENVPLTLENLSILHRYKLLSTALKLSIEELLQLRKVTESQIQLYPQNLFENLDKTYEFIEKLESIQSSKFDTEQIDYLLNYKPDSPAGISEETIKQYIENLRNELSKNKPENFENIIKDVISKVYQIETAHANHLLNTLKLHNITLMENIESEQAELLNKTEEGEYEKDINKNNFPLIFNVFNLLHKISLFIKTLKITPEELQWLTSYAVNLNLIDFEKLPIDNSVARILFPEWRNLVNIYKLKKIYPAHDGISIFGIFESIINESITYERLWSDIEKLTYWYLIDIKTLDEKRGITEPSDTVDSSNYTLDLILHYHKCIQMMKRIGVNVQTMFELSKCSDYNLQDNDVFDEDVDAAKKAADKIKQIVKAKYSNEQWYTISAALQNQIRDKKRGALVEYLVNNPIIIDGNQQWDDVSSLINYFLIDVEMSSCKLTTRVLQAVSTIQLFVQRYLMNLEKTVVEVDEAWKQWKWMKNYRVWEANRKVFVYPENWIEPELRDDKSQFFKELENELMQNEITDEYAESVFLNYLEKLDTVARLQVCGFYHEQDEETDIIHVIAKTPEKPSIYYYRKYITIDNIGHWTAWEKMDVQIDSEQVVPIVYNGQLHIFWPILTKKTCTEQNSSLCVSSDNYWEIQLAWSIYKNGKWTPKKVSDQKHIETWIYSAGSTSDQSRDEINKDAFHLRVNIQQNDNPNNDLNINVYRMYYDKNADTKKLSNFRHKIECAFYFNRKVIKVLRGEYLEEDINVKNSLDDVPGNSHFEYNYLVPNEVFNKNVIIKHKNDIGSYYDAWILRKLEYNMSHSLTIQTQQNQPNSFKNFFYQDNRHIYFISLSKVENIFFTVQIYNIYPNYHPYTDLFMREYGKYGLEGVLNRKIQIDLQNDFDFENEYGPNYDINAQIKYGEDYDDPNKEIVDFSYEGSYSLYNWELFFHIPLLIACKLSNNQRFEEAMKWFHYIFDPTMVCNENTEECDENSSSKYWKTKPFYKTNQNEYKNQRISTLMNLISEGDSELIGEIDEWRRNPFKPHLVARTRTVAYQKAVVMKYIDNILAWGDQLFRRGTYESINEATQLYLLAAEILGPRPTQLPKKEAEAKTFEEIELNPENDWDKFGNALVGIENLINLDGNNNNNGNNPNLPNISTLYFCIPSNEKLLAYWDKVADRLFKIRHCMDIEGVVRKLRLFEPPIEPGMLVRAAAAGIDISSALDDIDISTPYYRFNILSKKASDLCSELKSLGKALLSALEKRDSEELALLRASHQISILNKVKAIKQHQIEKAAFDLEALNRSKVTGETRKLYYEKINKYSGLEIANLGLQATALYFQFATIPFDIAAGLNYIFPQESIVVSAGTDTSTKKGTEYGGTQLASASGATSKLFADTSRTLSMTASLISTVANYERRKDEWNHRINLAIKEIEVIKQKIDAANKIKEIAELEFETHEKQIENAQAVDEYMHSQYTNRELYDWMVGQISSIYFQCYQLAYDVAKKAEKCYQFELGIEDSSFIQFGYWDSLKKGLLAGERLYQDIKRMEVSYIENNKRQFELTKHIALALLDPIALANLKENGECFIELPEMLFDLDYPGHYFRRIKSLSITIPCQADEYTTISCTVTLMENYYRKNNELNGSYIPENINEDLRFVQNPVQNGSQSIAASHAQNDSGIFELDFNDDRYLPFEGAGAISGWRIQLNKDFEQFDFNTISDVILNMKYTAKDGGDNFKTQVIDEIESKLDEIAQNQEDLFRPFSVINEFPNEWEKFIHSDEQELKLYLKKYFFPLFTKNYDIKIKNIKVCAIMKGEGTYSIELDAESDTLERIENSLVYTADLELDPVLDRGELSLKIMKGTEAVSEDDIEDLIIILNYELD